MRTMTEGFMHPKFWTNGKFVRDGRATIYYQLQSNGSIHYSVVYCSPKDQFVKAIGRKRAKAKFDRGEVSVYRPPRTLLLRDLAQKLPYEPNRPSWADFTY